MEQFRVYLRGELGKLKNACDAGEFLCGIGTEMVVRLQLPTTVEELQRLFSTQEDVNQFVASLPDIELQDLVRDCDEKWRTNGTFRALNKYEHWEVQVVSITDVDVQEAEQCFKYIFERHGYRLVDIARDVELMVQKPYVRSSVGDVVAYPVLLARQCGSRFKVFDGIHRAIQFARNNAAQLSLCLPYCEPTREKK